jgi:hypothetical protein
MAKKDLLKKALAMTSGISPVLPTSSPAPVQAHSGDWSKVPVVNPDDLIGKKVFPIMADLTKTGKPYTGIDSDQIKNPVPLQGGPGYSFIPINTQHGIVWAVQGKGRGSFKLGKDADYAVVTTMNPDTHQSNATFSNALIRTAMAHAKSGRLGGNSLAAINDMIRSPTADPNHAQLQNFPGLEHPDAEDFAKNLNFESRKRLTDVLASPKAQGIGAPNVNKITRQLLDKDFAGVNRSQALFLIKLDKSANNMVNLKAAGLPEHHSYDYGLKGTVVGRFHHPVAAQTLWKTWFDRKGNQDPNHVRRAFDLELPVGEITPEIAALLPRHPKDMQSPQSARLALHAALDNWHHTDDPVTEGGLSPTVMSNALKNSDSSSTLSQYSPKDIREMIKQGKFKGYKLRDGEVYFGLKRGTNYAEDYGFSHPELTNNETALTSVVNNEPGAKGIGGPAVVLKAIKEGATALDAYAVPSKKHPNGFLPDYYSHFGFKELGRVPFNPQYHSPQKIEDMKHEWRSQGWDESMGMPDLAIMKWKGRDDDRYDALRRHLGTGSTSSGPKTAPSIVSSARERLGRGAGQNVAAPQNAPNNNPAGNLGGIRNGNPSRPADILGRTISAATSMSPQEATTFGLEPELIRNAKKAGFNRGGKTINIDRALSLTSVYNAKHKRDAV